MSGWTIQLDPPAVSTGRTMLDLNSGPISVGTSGGSGVAIDFGTADITAYMTQQGMYGNSASDYVFPNRTITINLLLGGTDEQGNEETARSDLQQKVALLQREGGQLLRQRAGGPAMYADIVYATLVIPDEWGETGEVEPDVQLVLTCLPDFYGDEITLDTIHCTGFCESVLELSGAQAVIEGDYPARCRIIVTDTSGFSLGQWGLMWGFRSRYHTSASLSWAASTFLAVGGATLASTAGAYNGQALASGSLVGGARTLIATVSSVGVIGTYRVFVRCKTPSGTAPDLPEVQLGWTVGAGGTPETFNVAAPMPASGEFDILDLGVIRVDPTPFSTFLWTGNLFVTAFQTGQSVDIDELWLQPLDESAGIAGTDIATASTIVFPTSPTEVRTEGVYPRAMGTYAPVVSLGDLPRVPPSGMEQRPVEILVKPSRDVIPSSDSGGGDAGIDAFTVQVVYRPTWLSRP